MRPALELADIVREHGAAYRRTHALSPAQHAVLRDVGRCRTAALGGHLDVCPDCGHQQPSYNSCRNRHCPKCQGISAVRWIAARSARLLPTPYFHVVFTLPAELRGVARRNPRLVFGLLFKCAAETLLELGRDPERLGAQLGVTLVLHTWSRELHFHLHVHALVTAGGLSFDGERWVASQPDYLFPVKVLGALFRGKFLARLTAAHQQGLVHLRDDAPSAFRRLLRQLYDKDWVVYAKRPFGGPDQVLRYLGGYTHRVGISNQRLVSMNEHGVTFRTKAGKSITLPVDRFLSRFLQHVLPNGFKKIRHYGLLASSNATSRLELARRRLRAQQPGADTHESTPTSVIPAADLADWRLLLRRLTGIDLGRCPICGGARLLRRPLPPQLARAPPVAA